jgi:acyl carrier protein
MTEEQKKEQVQIVLDLLSFYRGRAIADSAETRRITFGELGLSSLTMASVVVELEDRLDRPFNFKAFAGVENVGGLLRAIGLA